MPTVTSIYTSGGDAKRITPPEHEITPPNPDDDVEEALNYAGEALAAIEALELTLADPTKVAEVNDVGHSQLEVAVENFIDKFDIPNFALEDATPEAAKTSRTKKVILYLYALVQRVFLVILDFFKNHKLEARKIIPLTKDYIGRSDSLTSSIANQLSIKDRSLMIALHIDGVAPKKLPELYEDLATTFEGQYKFSAVNDIIALIAAAKAKNPELVKKEAEALHAKLKSGLVANLKTADVSDMTLFNEAKAEDKEYYISPVMFGQNYIAGVIGKDVLDNGTFVYRCSIRRDPEVPLRVSFFPVLTPEEIRSVSRTSLRICENIIRFSRDEELLRKALRDATFVTTQETDESSVAALRDMSLLGQSSYIVYLRYTARTMQALMRWCNASLKQYEGIKNEHS